jgi:hypothetical protein
VDKPTRSFPRFVVEGHALLDGIPYYETDCEDGSDVVKGNLPGFAERITLKDGAPAWAAFEYGEWLEWHLHTANA